MRTGIVPILKLVNERITCLDIEKIDPGRRMSVKLELDQAKTHLNNARKLLQVEFPDLPTPHRNSA